MQANSYAVTVRYGMTTDVERIILASLLLLLGFGQRAEIYRCQDNECERGPNLHIPFHLAFRVSASQRGSASRRANGGKVQFRGLARSVSAFVFVHCTFRDLSGTAGCGGESLSDGGLRGGQQLSLSSAIEGDDSLRHGASRRLNRDRLPVAACGEGHGRAEGLSDDHDVDLVAVDGPGHVAAYLAALLGPGAVDFAVLIDDVALQLESVAVARAKQLKLDLRAATVDMVVRPAADALFRSVGHGDGAGTRPGSGQARERARVLHLSRASR